MRQSMFILALSGLAWGCAPKLGDDCRTNVDCSVNPGRFCDRSQPGGYCTIANCEPNSCGEEGVCVRFKPDEPRLSSSWCMANCSRTSDCGRDAYVCRSASALNENTPSGDRTAEVLDGRTNAKFCVVKDRP